MKRSRRITRRQAREALDPDAAIRAIYAAETRRRLARPVQKRIARKYHVNRAKWDVMARESNKARGG